MFKALTSKIKMPRVGPTGRAQNVSLGLGAAAAQISEAVMARVDEIEAARQTDAFNNATLGFNIDKNNNLLDQKNSDWRGGNEAFAADNIVLATKWSGTIDNDATRDKFNQFVKQASASAELNLKTHNRNKEKISRIETLNANVATMSDQFLKVHTNDERYEIEAQINDAYDIAAVGGWITPEAAGAQKKAWAGSLTFEMGKIQVQSDPHGVLDELGGGAPSFSQYKRALIRQESGGKAGAESVKGASGIMQVIPDTGRMIARELGELEIAQLNDAEIKAWLKIPANGERYGDYYLKQQLARFDGDWVLTLAAYNAGPGRPEDWVKKYGDPRKGEISRADFIEKIPFEETKNYVKSILKMAGGRGGVGTGKVSDAYEQMTFAQQQSLRGQAQKQIGLLNADVDAQLGIMNKNIVAGVAPLQSQINDLVALGASIGRDDIVEQAGAMQDLSGLAENWQQATIADVQNDVAALTLAATNEGASAGDVLKAQFGIEKLAVMQKAVKADPVAYAIGAGHEFIKPLVIDEQSLDPNVVASFVASLQDRAAGAAKLAEYYGGEPRLFSNGERQDLMNLFNGADLAGKAKLSSIMFKSFGADLPEFLNEIAENGAADALTISLASQGNARAAQFSHIGAIALHDKTVKMPSKNDVNVAFNDFVGVAIPASQTQMRGAVLQVAKQIYAGKIVTGMVTGEDFDVEAFDASVDEALGKTNHGGGIAKQEASSFGLGGIDHSFLLPSHLTLRDVESIDENVTADNFSKLIGSADAIHGDGESEFLVDELAGAYKINVGHGKYNISMTDPDMRLELVVDAASGQALVLDYNDVEAVDFPKVEVVKEPRKARRFHSSVVNDFIPEEKTDNLYDYLRNGPLNYAIDLPATANFAGNKFDFEAAKILRKHLKRGGYSGDNEVIDLKGLKKKIESLGEKYPDNKHEARLMFEQIQLHMGGE